MPTKCDSEPLPGAEPNTAAGLRALPLHQLLEVGGAGHRAGGDRDVEVEMPAIGVKSATGS